MRVFHFVIVKRKRALRSNSFFFFFNDSHIFLKYFNSNHNLSSYSLFSKCFLWLFYFGVHRGTGVFSWFFFFFSFHSSPREWLALALASHLPPFDRKTLKNCACSADPGLLNERVHGFLFLVFLHIKTDGKNKLFFTTTSTFR